VVNGTGTGFRLFFNQWRIIEDQPRLPKQPENVQG
jgi:hypothetical protein